MKNKVYSRKNIIRDNAALQSDLENCRNRNTELVILNEQANDAIQAMNKRIIQTNELINVNDKLRQKHSRIRKRLTEIMEQFNITYNADKGTYEQSNNSKNYIR